MSKLKEIYEKMSSGHNMFVWPSREEFLEAIEEEHPEFTAIKVKKKNAAYLRCLKTALKNFNPKWVDGAIQGLEWAYFIPDDFGCVNVQEVYDFFKNLVEESEKKFMEDLGTKN